MTVTNGYCSNAELKAICQITGSSDDIIVDLAINAASRWADDYTGRRFWQDTTVVARQFYADNWKVLCVDDGISTTTGLIVQLDEDDDGTFERTLTITTDFTLAPLNGPDMYPVRPYTEIVMTGTYSLPRTTYRPGVQVTAKWGWPAVPDQVKAATVLAARDFYKEMKSAPFGVADFNADGPLRIGQNRTARTLLDPYRIPPVG